MHSHFFARHDTENLQMEIELIHIGMCHRCAGIFFCQGRRRSFAWRKARRITSAVGKKTEKAWCSSKWTDNKCEKEHKSGYGSRSCVLRGILRLFSFFLHNSFQKIDLCGITLPVNAEGCDLVFAEIYPEASIQHITAQHGAGILTLCLVTTDNHIA